MCGPCVSQKLTGAILGNQPVAYFCLHSVCEYCEASDLVWKVKMLILSNLATLFLNDFPLSVGTPHENSAQYFLVQFWLKKKKKSFVGHQDIVFKN